MNLKILPRVIEKIIMDDVMYDYYLKEHKINFKKTLVGINILSQYRSPNFYNIFKIIRIFSL